MDTELLITSILTKYDEKKTTVTVTVFEEVAVGLSKEKHRYKLVVNNLYTDPADPALMAAIADKLALLPE
jgi:hypothetical protein